MTPTAREIVEKFQSLDDEAWDPQASDETMNRFYAYRDALVALIEAGQALRDEIAGHGRGGSVADYDAALARVEKAVEGEP